MFGVNSKGNNTENKHKIKILCLKINTNILFEIKNEEIYVVNTVYKDIRQYIVFYRIVLKFEKTLRSNDFH